MALRAVGAGSSADLAIEVLTIQNPIRARQPRRVDLPVWTMVSDPRGQGGAALRPVYAQGSPNAQQAIGRIAYQPFRKDVWDPAARDLAASAGPGGRARVHEASSRTRHPRPTTTSTA
ncbi:MAG: hypothetical protein U0235_31020 [Polyangiaceae bacterium]